MTVAGTSVVIIFTFRHCKSFGTVVVRSVHSDSVKSNIESFMQIPSFSRLNARQGKKFVNTNDIVIQSGDGDEVDRNMIPTTTPMYPLSFPHSVTDAQVDRLVSIQKTPGMNIEQNLIVLSS